MLFKSNTQKLDHEKPMRLPRGAMGVGTGGTAGSIARFMNGLGNSSLPGSRPLKTTTIGAIAGTLIGLEANLEMEGPNDVLAVTASPEEHRHYVDFIVANPTAARHYKVLFTDIYTLSEELLPVFDLVTLFHLHEFYDDKKQWYAHLNDRSLLGMFLRKLRNGGLVFFYKGSNGFNLTARTLKEYIATQRLIFHEEYKSLVVYRRGPNGGLEGE
jgi:hypothetical protein